MLLKLIEVKTILALSAFAMSFASCPDFVKCQGLALLELRIEMKRFLPLLAIGALFMIIPANTNASANEDKKAVAALDTEYQAAVKNNDAATMGRILADDFVLVVGSGKTYTKADLLKSAV